MERTIIIDGKEVRLRASASIPRLYRIKFQRDIIHDISFISKALDKSLRARKAAAAERAEPAKPETDAQPEAAGQAVVLEMSDIPMEALTMFENVAYLMAKHADPTVPSSAEDWLDGFETFSIYQVFPVIQEMWEANIQTKSVPVKK